MFHLLLLTCNWYVVYISTLVLINHYTSIRGSTIVLFFLFIQGHHILEFYTKAQSMYLSFRTQNVPLVLVLLMDQIYKDIYGTDIDRPNIYKDIYEYRYRYIFYFSRIMSNVLDTLWMSTYQHSFFSRKAARTWPIFYQTRGEGE